MARKKKFIDKKAPGTQTFHVVHRSQRDPLAADPDAPQHVLMPARTNKGAVFEDFSYTYSDEEPIDIKWDDADENSGNGEGESEESDDGAGALGGQGASAKGKDPKVSGIRPAKSLKSGGGVSLRVRKRVSRIRPVPGAVKKKPIDPQNFNVFEYLGIAAPGTYDYSQHLKPMGSRGGVFISRDGTIMNASEAPDIHVGFDDDEEPAPSNPYGLPDEMFASAKENPVGLLNLAAPVTGPRPEIPHDVLEALFLDNAEFEEIDDDFMAKANAPIADDDLDWMAEYEEMYRVTGAYPPEYAARLAASAARSGGTRDPEGGEDGSSGGDDAGSGVDWSSDGGQFSDGDEDVDYGRGPLGGGKAPARPSRPLSPGVSPSITSSVSRYRKGLLAAEDDKLEVMMERQYNDDNIGELSEAAARGEKTIDLFADIIDAHFKDQASVPLIDYIMKQREEDGEGEGLNLRHLQGDTEPHYDDDNGEGVTAARLTKGRLVDENPNHAHRVVIVGKNDPVTAAALAKAEASDSEEEVKEVIYENVREFDAESIISTYTSSENHPGIIRAPAPAKKIRLSAKTGIPLGVLESKKAAGGKGADGGGSRDESGEDESHSGESDDNDETESMVSVENFGVKRAKDETSEERKARKARVKAAKKEAREKKKAMKVAYKNEGLRLARVTTGVKASVVPL